MTGVGFAGYDRAEDDDEIQFIGNPSPLTFTPSIAPIQSAEPLFVLHYHTFKNAGSSFDETLRQSFGGDWVEQEFTVSAKQSNADEVQAFLLDNPGLKALSSHTARLPLPQIPGVRVFPVFFFRHPILRLQSAYRFESRQDADTFGSRLARGNDFAGYIQGLFDAPTNRQVRDFQTHRLAFGDDEGVSEAERALRTLRDLPFVGLVEAYDESLRRLDAALSPIIRGFRPAYVRKNVTAVRDDLSVAEQLGEVRAELGDDLYLRLEANNLTDLHIFNMVAGSYGLPTTPSVDWISR